MSLSEKANRQPKDHPNPRARPLACYRTAHNRGLGARRQGERRSNKCVPFFLIAVYALLCPFSLGFVQLHCWRFLFCVTHEWMEFSPGLRMFSARAHYYLWLSRYVQYIKVIMRVLIIDGAISQLMVRVAASRLLFLFHIRPFACWFGPRWRHCREHIALSVCQMQAKGFISQVGR